MFERGEKKVVAIAARDPNLDRALMDVVAALHGGDQTFLLRTSADWERLPTAGRWMIFIDSSLVDLGIEENLRAFEHLVLFNYKGNERRVNSILEPISDKRTPNIVKHDYLLTETLLRSQYGSQISSRKVMRTGVDQPIQRMRSVSMGEHQSIYTGSVLRSEGLRDFLSLLMSGLAEEDYGTLSRSFVSDASRMRIPDSQRLTNIPPSELREAADILRKFATYPGSSGKGCFLVGKKGAGKSTLAYYVGRTLDKEGHVLCVGVDYTLESDFGLQGRLLVLMDSFEKYCTQAAELSISGYPQTIIFRARQYIGNIIKDGNYNVFKNITPEAERLLTLEADRGFITHMYCYYEMSGRRPEETFFDYSSFTNLVMKAELWYNDLRYDLPRLFAMYLNFLISPRSKDGFDMYTYRAILRYILSIEEHSESAIRAVEHAAKKLNLQSIFVEATGKLSPEQVLTESFDIPPSLLRRLVFDVLDQLSQGRPLLLLLDNLDQRTSVVIEARAIHDALRLFEDQIHDRFSDARTIVAIRDTTLHSQQWASMAVDITKAWKHVLMLPPDLVTILKKRCIEWQQRGVNIGAQGYRRSMMIVTWITELPITPKSEDDGRGLGLIDIIQHRHPFNVREQLRTFARCCENVILHREWQKSREEKQRNPWPDKSYEFFLRVFLLGESRFFDEEHCEIPNLYDNGFPSSPFNTCIRPWLLLGLPTKDRPFDKVAFIKTYVDITTREDEVVAALKALERYSLILSLPQKDQAVLSIWGEYFREKIGFDLPYISTIWWTTSVLYGYSLGEAHEVQPSELRDYAGKFLRWLDHEQDLARSRAKVDDMELPDIFEHVSSNVSWSLRKIEMVI